jgi:hypothetical protein
VQESCKCFIRYKRSILQVQKQQKHVNTTILRFLYGTFGGYEGCRATITGASLVKEFITRQQKIHSQQLGPAKQLIFQNADLMENTKVVNKTLGIHCNASITSTNQVKELPGYSQVCYHPNTMQTLSFSVR